MAKKWLRDCHIFIGHVKIGDKWMRAPVSLQPNLNLHIFLPASYTVGRNEHRPECVKGQIEDWNLNVIDGGTSVSYYDSDLNFLNKLVPKSIDKEEIGLFLKENQKKFWTEIVFTPRTVIFEKVNLPNSIPDEWGITFYPTKNNNILFRFFRDPRNPRGLPRRLPNTFTTVDRCVYISNVKRWSVAAFVKRLKLLTPALSFFTGAPVTHEVLIGRFKRELSHIQVNNISNPNAFLCPSQYNSRIEIKGRFLSTFPTMFIESIEELFNNGKDERVGTILSYFRMLYMALYDEAKIAFSFQVMESLAKYKDIECGETYKNKIIKRVSKKVTKKMCPACNSLLQAEIKTEKDDFTQYIDKALNVLKADNEFSVNPETIKSIARKYRNEIFHGGFLERMTKVEDFVKTMPEGYQRDLPLLFQALAAIIGVNFILGIDFSHMKALKRKMH